MSNLTDFMEQMLCALDNPGTKSLLSSSVQLMDEEGLIAMKNKGINACNAKITSDLTPEEKKIAKREYLRNYMREYKKTYVQPEINKSHATKRRRKYRTALITSARIRKNADKLGIVIKNSYKIKINKGEQQDEVENKICKPSSSDNI